MNPFTGVDPDRLLSGESDWLGPEAAAALTEHPLDCIVTEYPHYVREVDGPDDVPRPSDRHPTFYGCYDWHSAVHSHWALLRGLRLFDDHPEEATVRDRLSEHLTPDRLSTEAEYLADNPGFENPYGLAWVLALAAELSLFEDDADANAWREAIEPLESQAVENLRSELLTLDRPIRVGTHGNSAFALSLTLDYARTVDDPTLEEHVLETARRFYWDDEAAPVEYEPVGWDFLSPSLVEADLMGRVLPEPTFREWSNGFFPDLTVEPYERILDPIDVDPDEGDGMELHLVGLNCSKAWCLAGIAGAFDGGRYAGLIEDSARQHAARAVASAFTDDYAGAHWLSSFVLYLLTRNEGGIARRSGPPR